MLNLVAEIACGHCGDWAKLDVLVSDALAVKNVTAIKFQIYEVSERSEPGTKEYSIFSTHFLPQDAYSEQIARIQRNGLLVYADIYGISSLQTAYSLGLDGIKIHAEDSGNYLLIEECLNTFPTVIISIGGLTYKEILELRDFCTATIGQMSGRETPPSITFVDGIQLFPTPREGHSLGNISVVNQILSNSQIAFGVADHLDPGDSFAYSYVSSAIAIGATYVEKHLTHDRSLRWTDWESALEASELCNFFSACASTYSSLNDCSTYSTLSVTYKQMFQKYPVIIPPYSDTPSPRDVVFKKLRSNSSTLLSGKFVRTNSPCLHSLQTKGSQHALTYRDYAPKIGLIICARLSSSRFPSKALSCILGVPSLQIVLERARRIIGIHQVIIATSTDPSDDPLVDFAAQNSCHLFRGPLADLPLRMLLASQEYKFDHVVRITGDCVCLDYDGMSHLLAHHLDVSPDISILTGGVFGTTREILSFEALRFLSDRILDKQNSEYLEYYMQLPNLMRLSMLSVAYSAEQDLIENRLTLDYPEDLVAIQELYNEHQEGIMAPVSDLVEILSDRDSPLPNVGLVQKSPLLLGLNLGFSYG